MSALIILLIAAIAFVAIRKKSKKEKKSTQAAKSKPAQAVPVKVYVVEGGRAYHSNSICQYAYGKKWRLVDKSKAKADGLKPCKKCYPYGN